MRLYGDFNTSRIRRDDWFDGLRDSRVMSFILNTVKDDSMGRRVHSQDVHVISSVCFVTGMVKNGLKSCYEKTRKMTLI